MNKLLILLAALSLSATAASAQTAPTAGKAKAQHEHAGKTPKTPEQRADHMTQRLTKSLKLTADQSAKVRQLYLTQAQERQADRAKYAADANKAGRHAALKAKRAQYDAQLKQILSADQYNKYAQERTERMAKHKDKMKAKG